MHRGHQWDVSSHQGEVGDGGWCLGADWGLVLGGGEWGCLASGIRMKTVGGKGGKAMAFHFGSMQCWKPGGRGLWIRMGWKEMQLQAGYWMSWVELGIVTYLSTQPNPTQLYLSILKYFSKLGYCRYSGCRRCTLYVLWDFFHLEVSVVSYDQEWMRVCQLSTQF